MLVRRLHWFFGAVCVFYLIPFVYFAFHRERIQSGFDQNPVISWVKESLKYGKGDDVVSSYDTLLERSANLSQRVSVLEDRRREIEGSLLRTGREDGNGKGNDNDKGNHGSQGVEDPLGGDLVSLLYGPVRYKMGKKVLENLKNTAVVIVCYNRPKHLEQAISGVLRAAFHDDSALSLFISQDGNHEGVASVAQKYSEMFEHVQLEHSTDATWDSAHHVAYHYKRAFEKMFVEKGFEWVIVIEDDLDISYDFFHYFDEMVPLLLKDPTLWCASSWNDNGLGHLEGAKMPHVVRRTSYFPGLGWMLHRSIWMNELREKFPEKHWDHWMRVDAQHNDRDCLYPVLSRNFNVGSEGSFMKSDIYQKLFKQNPVFAEKQLIDFPDVFRLEQSKYDADVSSLLSKSAYVHHDEAIQSLQQGHVDAGFIRKWANNLKKLQNKDPAAPVVITYNSPIYSRLAGIFRIWDVPRTHHRNLVTLDFAGQTVYLAHERMCSLLPLEKRIPLLRDSATIVAAPAGVSCSQYCHQEGMQCVDGALEEIQSCHLLAKHFNCRLCTQEWGHEIPAYVASSSHPNYGSCLVTEFAAKCGAAHPDTRRLCPCAHV